MCEGEMSTTKRKESTGFGRTINSPDHKAHGVIFHEYGETVPSVNFQSMRFKLCLQATEHLFLEMEVNSMETPTTVVGCSSTVK